MVDWMRANLFSSALNSAITLGVLGLLFAVVPPLFDWAIISADWSGVSRDDCRREGACWVFVGARMEQFLYGFYPEPQQWRIHAALVLLGAAALPFAIARLRAGLAWAAVLVPAYIVAACILLYGGVLGLSVVPTEKWGGLTLTLVVAFVGISASLPIGIALALGRVSELPVIRILSACTIEVWRGVPLITVLFMAAVMLPLFLPEGGTLDKLVRALIAVSIFAGAYMAEVVRGGLQSVPAGQHEAAASLGLGYWRTMGLVVLPQALRAVLPAIMNVFVALLKDTTLVLIVGLFDLLGIIQAALSDPNWLGFAVEGYAFAAVVFWALCFSMSRMSAHLETRLGGARRL